MKKGLKYFVVILTVLSICSVNVKAANVDGYTCKTISVSGKYSDTNNNNSYKKIIRSYKDLLKLKRYIKKNYNAPKKYIKKLNKYKKSYFKKKVLIFATENVDLNFLSYKLLSITKKDEKIILNVEKRNLLKEGEHKTTMVIYGANTYMIEAKKSKLKNVKKVKITYDFVNDSEE